MGSEITQSLVGADGVVSSLPVEQFLVELGDRERAGGDLIKLLGMRAVGALDPAVQFGRARRQDEEADAALAGSCNRRATLDNTPTQTNTRVHLAVDGLGPDAFILASQSPQR